MTTTFQGTTHPPRYLFHKYWARKPANVVRDHVERYARRGAVVLDPFCGSGVAAVEAAAAGRRALGVDLNPVAVRMALATLTPLEPKLLAEALAQVRREVGDRLRGAFEARCPDCGSGARVRYRVFASEATCGGCGRSSVLGCLEQTGRRGLSRCEGCGARLTPDTVTADQLLAEAVECPRCWRGAKLRLATGRVLLERSQGLAFVANRRVLSYPGLHLSGLYHPESWAAMLAVREALDRQPAALQPALLTAFTGGAAQASRLIPFRGNLSSGGPAWTVPGFWVPAVHLQLDPWRCFENRIGRLTRALADARRALGAEVELGASPDDVLAGRATAWVGEGSATELPLPDGSVDYVLTDPPYGDAVPYLEFSQLWNGWLGAAPDLAREVVVSDAPGRGKDLDDYGRGLAAAFAEVARVLKPGSPATVFFQNKAPAVWAALEGAVAAAGFTVEDRAELTPAVVPAKTQLAREGSLVGEVVLQLRRSSRSARRAPRA